MVRSLRHDVVSISMLSVISCRYHFTIVKRHSNKLRRYLQQYCLGQILQSNPAVVTKERYRGIYFCVLHIITNTWYSVTTTPFLHEKMLKICCRCFKNILNNIGHFCKYFLFGYQGNGQCICIIITTNNNYKIIQIHTLLILL